MSDTRAIDEAIKDFEHRLELVERWLGNPRTWEFANTPYDRDALVRQKEVLTGRLASLREQLDNPPVDSTSGQQGERSENGGE